MRRWRNILQHWQLWMAVFAFVNACSAFAQPLSIPYTDSPFAIDGKGEDWDADPLVVYTQQNPIPSNANTFSVRMAWDEQYLYLLIEVQDRNLVTLASGEGRTYINDAVEVYIDPLGDSQTRMDINDYQFIVAVSGEVEILKGDKTRIKDSLQTAPKESGIATLAFRKGVNYTGTINVADQDEGYAVEMALPFAGMGVVPSAQTAFSLDVCVDDADSVLDIQPLPEGLPIPHFFYANWAGEHDFSFPQRWRSCQLVGGPSTAMAISRKLVPYWLYIVLGLVMVAAAVIGWQAYRIAQLREVPIRRSLSTETMRDLLPVAEANVLEVQQEATLRAKEQQSPEAKHPLIEKCTAYISQRIDQEINLESLASECAVSLRQLQRIFKDEMGISPGNLVVIIKMEHAAQLLKSKKVNVSEAAWQLGFTDGSYFSRVFKKYHGLSPKAFLDRY